MTWQMLVQSFVIPIIAAIISYLINRKPLYILTIGIWISSMWQTSFSFHSMNVVALALTLTTICTDVQTNRFSNWIKHTCIIAIGIALYWWMVRRFTAQLNILEWIFPLGLVALSYIFSVKTTNTRINFVHLAWIAPLGGLALVISLFGSVKIGVLSGTFALTSLFAWIIFYINKYESKTFAIWIALPSVFTALLAYHFAEIEPMLLVILFSNWILISILGNSRPATQFTVIFITGIVTTGLTLYLGWPEQGFY